MTLTPDDKGRIREEELYRSEVRRSLEPNPTIRSRAWAAINAPVVIWGLSGVLLSGVAKLSSDWQLQVRRAEELRRLKSEFTYRVERASALVDAAFTDEGSFSANVKRAISVLSDGVDRVGGRDTEIYAFKEYQSLGAIPILFQIENLCIDSTSRTQIEWKRKHVVQWCNQPVTVMDEMAEEGLLAGLREIGKLPPCGP
jgi:hypothetical protein